MRSSAWSATALATVILVGVGAVFGAWIPARLVMTVWMICSVVFRLRRREADVERSPWSMVALGASLTLLGAIVRAIHMSLTGVENAFPSPADGFSLLGYVLLIAAIMRFGTLRAGYSDRRAVVDAFVDGVIVAASAWIVMFGGILASYLANDAVPLEDRFLNSVYATLAVVLFAATVRLAFGPGVRNISLVMMILASLLIVVNEVLMITDARFSSAVFSVLAMASASIGVLHPSANRITASLSTVESTLSRGRIVLIASALLVVPFTLLASELRAAEANVVVLVVGTTLMSAALLVRIRRLFHSNEQLAAAVAQETADERYRRLTEGSGDVIMVLDQAGMVSFATENCASVLGRSADRFIGRSLIEEVGVGDAETLEELVNAAGCSDESFSTELALERQGQWRWFSLEMRDHSAVQGVEGLVVNIRDIHDRHQSEARVLRSEARFRSLVQRSSDIVAICDEDGILTYISPASFQILGYEPAELIGTSVLEVMSMSALSDTNELREQLSKGAGEQQSFEIRTAAKDGSWRFLSITATNLTDDPAVEGFVLNVRDDTERLSLERTLRHQATHDSLTKLANRSQFSDALVDVLSDSSRLDEVISVMFIDIDDFKTVNDGLGHAAGDQVLIAIGERLRRVVRINDVVARFGGDEFAILLTRMYGEHEALDTASRILEEVSKPLPLEGRNLALTASIGVAFDRNRSVEPADLIKQADVAMYASKDKGKGRVSVFSDSMMTTAGGRLDLIDSLRDALENNQITVHYQPIVSLGNERIVGFEALARWEHPERGMISPAGFIPVAEETGLIEPLGLSVLTDAAKQLGEWVQNGHDIYVSVNVSVKQLQNSSVVSVLSNAVKESGLAFERVLLEVTESVFVADKDLVADRLRKLRAKGFRIAIDDFGTGYSSLQYLQQFDFDVLKIDKSFVDRLGTEDDTGMVQTVLDLAQRMGATTVAEGIESAQQATLLRGLRCELGQGYYYARPMSAEKTGAALAAEPLPLSDRANDQTELPALKAS